MQIIVVRATTNQALAETNQALAETCSIRGNEMKITVNFRRNELGLYPIGQKETKTIPSRMWSKIISEVLVKE